jgi:hypothetical protein
VISAKQRKASLGKNLVMVYTEKVWIYLTSRQKLPTFWDLQEAEFLCFLSSQHEKEKVQAAGAGLLDPGSTNYCEATIFLCLQTTVRYPKCNEKK